MVVKNGTEKYFESRQVNLSFWDIRVIPRAVQVFNKLNHVLLNGRCDALFIDVTYFKLTQN